ncbi:MAG: hypothetical protein LBU64_13695 [Planctomycetota bacterium]|jgi:signal transduction histidine kinase|nr:hypothetical protein [Planctomycetota bacterium]
MGLKDALKRNVRRLALAGAAFSLLTAVACLYAGHLLKRQLDIHSLRGMQMYKSALQTLMRAHENALNHVAASVRMAIDRGVNPEELQGILRTWTGTFRNQRDIREVFGSVYGYLNGNYLDGTNWIPGEFYNPKTAPWLRGALLQNGVHYSRSYLDPRSGKVVNAVSRVIFDEKGESRGVLAIDYLLNPIIEEVKTYRIADAGYGMLLDDSFSVLGHPDPGLIGRDIRELAGYSGIFGNPGELGDRVLKGTVYSEGTENVGVFSRLENGWYLGILTPAANYYRDVRSLTGFMILAGAILFPIYSLLLIRQDANRTRREEEARLGTRFLTRLSHEIRTPLNTIIGMSELAARDSGRPQSLEYLAEIKRSGLDLLATLNDILDFSKLKSGRFQLTREPYRIPELLLEVLRVVKAGLKNGEVVLTADIDPKIPRKLIGDRSRVRKILLNLLGNSVKYTRAGFIGLTVRGEGTGDDGIRLALAIADSGEGIKPGDLPGVFDVFYAPEQFGGHADGLGLGLAISRILCREMGGDLTVESEYGKGSVFTASIRQSVADWQPMGLFDLEREIQAKDAPPLDPPQAVREVDIA